MKTKFLVLSTLLATFGLIFPATAQVPPNIASQLERNVIPQDFFTLQRNQTGFFQQGQNQLERQVQVLMTPPDANPNTLLVIRDVPSLQFNPVAFEDHRLLQNQIVRSNSQQVPTPRQEAY